MINLSVNWWTIILSIGASQGLLLAALLFFNKRGNRRANLLIACLVLLLVWHLLEYISISSGFYQIFPHFFGTGYGSWFLIGPLLFFYTLLMTEPGFQFKKIHLIHLVPFFIYDTIGTPVFLMDSADKSAYIQQWVMDIESSRSVSPSYYLMFGSQFMHMFIYIVITFKRLRVYEQRVKNSVSNTEKVNLGWLKMLVLGFDIVLVVSVVVYIVLFSTSFYTYSMEYIYLITMTALLYAIAFYAMRQPEIYLHDIVFRANGNGGKKYEKSSLTEEKSSEYLSKLLDYMESEKPFLESELKLNTLSEKLGIMPNHVSQVINEQLGLSFYDFVNKYRVDEAKRILSNTSATNNPTFLQVAFDVGFNSKTSFNRAFKKHTNLTPSDFKRSSSGPK